MKTDYQTKEMQAYCISCPVYSAAVGCGRNKIPAECRKKHYETKKRVVDK